METEIKRKGEEKDEEEEDEEGGGGGGQERLRVEEEEEEEEEEGSPIRVRPRRCSRGRGCDGRPRPTRSPLGLAHCQLEQRDPSRLGLGDPVSYSHTWYQAA